MYFNNGAIGRAHDELEPLGKGIADMLITELSANPGIRVVERDQLQKLLGEQDLAAGGRVDAETAARVGKLLGARHMILGGFVTDARGNMRLVARAVDVETSRVEYVQTLDDKTDNFMAMVSRLAERMNAGMKLPALPKAARDASAERARKLPFQTAMLYARAISEDDKGNRDKAVELYRAVLQQFPGYGPAEQAIAKLQGAKPGA
jgi:curli biogenesis system outer membrane secretion channel CsgG